jgi:hypothetical protein
LTSPGNLYVLPESFLLWSHLLLIAAAVTYCTRDPISDDNVDDPAARRWHILAVGRSLAAAAVTAYVAGSSILLPIIVFVFCAALPLVRFNLPARYCAELEVTASIAFALATLYIVDRGNVTMARAFFLLPVSNQQIATACLIAALLLLTVHGGTYIVRGVLKKSGAVPTIAVTEPAEAKIDLKEYNRGRLIGALERILLLAVVIAGSYEALGFIVAAKGLIRAREFELSRDMTEYFLIGSLTSVLVALATGSLARQILNAYW